MSIQTNVTNNPPDSRRASSISRALLLVATLLAIALASGCNLTGLPATPTSPAPTVTPAFEQDTSVSQVTSTAPEQNTAISQSPNTPTRVPRATGTGTTTEVPTDSPAVLTAIAQATLLVPTAGPTEEQQALPPTPTIQPLSLSQRLEVFEDTWQLVRDNYVYTDFRGLDWDQVHDEYEARIRADKTELDVYDTLADMIDSLGDEHSSFANPQQAAEDDAMQRGDLKLSGIGVLTQDIQGAVRIVYVIPGGPADKAGLRAFDIIRAANGIPIKQNNDAPRLVRGPAGTTVILTIESPGQPPRNVPIVRATVNFAFQTDAKRWPGTNVGYLDLLTFDIEGISDQVANTLEQLNSDGPLDGLIIDIRQNGGGLISEEHDIEGLFINGGNAGYDLTRDGRIPHQIPRGQTLNFLEGKPIVVLVSQGSVSAAERFASVMQDYKRATILGTNTAANAETVYPHNLPYGSRLLLAQATFLRVDGKTGLEGTGVTPDIVMDVPWYTMSPDQDPQIAAAVKKIQGK